MSYKKFVVVFSSILLLPLATGTAWANTPIVSIVRIPPRQPVPIIQDNGAASLPANENSTNSTLVRTGVFGGAEDRATTKRLVEQVQTGVFWSPEGFPGNAQGYSLGNVLRFGLFGPPADFDAENATWERHDVQGRRLRKRGSEHRIWSRIWRGR